MANRKPLPDQATLKRLLNYDAETGVLTWRARTPDLFEGNRSDQACRLWNFRFAGKPAFSRDERGYLKGTLIGHRVSAHRVAFKMAHGVEPDEIDHKNGKKDDNRICNLRSVSHTENQRNMRHRKTNRPGIAFHIRRKKWVAYISDGYKRLHLGVFDSEEAAWQARCGAADQLGYSKDHRRPTLDIALTDHKE